MTAYHPIATMQQLESAGFKRQQAEALAQAISDGRDDLVTRSDLRAELNKMALNLFLANAAFMALCTTLIGVVVTLHH